MLKASSLIAVVFWYFFYVYVASFSLTNASASQHANKLSCLLLGRLLLKGRGFLSSCCSFWLCAPRTCKVQFAHAAYFLSMHCVSFELALNVWSA